jgi:hypothetical protein
LTSGECSMIFTATLAPRQRPASASHRLGM